MTTVSINIDDNVSVYRSPPGDFCPYCLEKGRGVAKFIPVMHDVEDIIWLCENWRVCLYPLIAGPATVSKHTMPRTSVDPKLLGYIPLDEDDRKRNRNRADLMNLPEEDKSSSLDFLSTISPVTGPRSPSILSHCTTSSNGSDPELTLLHPNKVESKTTAAPLVMPSPPVFEDPLLEGLDAQIDSVFTTLPSSPPLNIDSLFSFANDNVLEPPPPKKAKVLAPPFAFARRALPPPPNSVSSLNTATPMATQPLTDSPIPRPVMPMSQMISAPSTPVVPLMPTAAASSYSAPSKKRALIETKKPEKPLFPGYVSEGGSGNLPKLDVTSKSTATVLSMVMKKLKKGN